MLLIPLNLTPIWHHARYLQSPAVCAMPTNYSPKPYLPLLECLRNVIRKSTLGILFEVKLVNQSLAYKFDVAMHWWIKPALQAHGLKSNDVFCRLDATSISVISTNAALFDWFIEYDWKWYQLGRPNLVSGMFVKCSARWNPIKGESSHVMLENFACCTSMRSHE